MKRDSKTVSLVCACCGDKYLEAESDARRPDLFCNWMCEANEEEWVSMTENNPLGLDV